MKKGINLFLQQKPSETSIKLQSRIRQYVTILGVVLFIIFLSITYFQIIIKQHINQQLSQKQQLLDFLASNKENEAKTIVFINKEKQLKTFLKDDAQFLPYYSLLNDSLNISTEKPTIQSMTIEKDKSTSFTVGFTDYKSAYNFLKNFESPEFLKNFVQLNLVNFAASQETGDLNKGYELQFQGKFAQINENRL